MNRKIVVATLNPGKYSEITEIMSGLPYRWVPGESCDLGAVAETGDTYEANALIKGQAFSAATGLPALADDSGLEVDCINGLPGVKSNRYFGETLPDTEKVCRLLEKMKGVSPENRTARFRCTAILVSGSEIIVSRTGTVEGLILTEPRGVGGFGFDPVFWIPHLDQTFAELSHQVKKNLSHRGQAMRLIRHFLLRHGTGSW